MKNLNKKLAIATMSFAMVASAIVPTASVAAATRNCPQITISSNCFNDVNSILNNISKNNSYNSNAFNTANNNVFTSGKLCYKITGKNTCSVVGLKQSYQNATSCTIPSSVTCNGKTYKVTSIDSNAFSNNGNLKKVTCGSSKLSNLCSSVLSNSVKIKTK